MRPWIILVIVVGAACSGVGEPKFDSPHRMQGLWRNGFEESVFCPAPAKECRYIQVDQRSAPLIWLDASISFPADIKSKSLGGLYAIDFVGRRTTNRGRYGHMGVFDEEVIVDRLISIQEVEAPPKN